MSDPGRPDGGSPEHGEAEHGLAASCPVCSTPIASFEGSWACPEHGPTTPLWRPREASYDAFGVHLRLAGPFPTYLPWPVGPGWRCSDFALVGDTVAPALAVMTCLTGISRADGPVDVMVVTEEPGTGLGSRCAGIDGVDPGPEVGRGQPSARVVAGNRPAALWLMSTSSADADFDRSVLVGEAAGRWLWVILRPASALLLWHDEPILSDVSQIGASLIEMPFGGAAPSW